jgi:hypothetical protein
MTSDRGDSDFSFFRSLPLPPLLQLSALTVQYVGVEVYSAIPFFLRAGGYGTIFPTYYDQYAVSFVAIVELS